MDFLLTALKAAAEPTRLRLLALCAHGELTVSELTQILGQSQPRVSRHLKLLCDAGLLDRFREGTWAFYRLGERSAFAGLARTLIDAIPADDPTLALDLERLNAIKRARAEAAAEYFRENAARWHEIRSLHVPEQDVEAALLKLLPAPASRTCSTSAPAPAVCWNCWGQRSNGRSASICRARCWRSPAPTWSAPACGNCQVRQSDMYQLPLPSASFDAVLVHQVLHYAEEPAEVLAEAARVLRPGGSLVIVDFARHDHEIAEDRARPPPAGLRRRGGRGLAARRRHDPRPRRPPAGRPADRQSLARRPRRRRGRYAQRFAGSRPCPFDFGVT